MNDASAKQTDGVAEPQATETTTPHFDAMAIADAQPVEPLPPERFRWFAFSYEPIVIILAFAVIFAIAVAASVLVLSTEQTKAAEPPAPTEQLSTDEAAQMDVLAGALADDNDAAAAGPASKTDGRSLSRKTVKRSRSQNRTLLTDDEGRPVARKVGEIRYGRNPN
jgi:hypothetical protein